MEENKITLVDEEGNKQELNVIYSFHLEETGKNYIVFDDPKDEESLIVAIIDESGNLIDIEDDEEFDKVDMAVNEYLDSLEDK